MFHFFLVSHKLPEALKTDRNFAQSWDAMGVLCQGEWTAEREALPAPRSAQATRRLRRLRHADLCARQPQRPLVRPRRGKPGRRPPAGRPPDRARRLHPAHHGLHRQRPARHPPSRRAIEPDHPLRRPYHAQFCSAFMLREYVFDLVDHLARARNPDAARLAPAYRRYLGLGNAAATGLVAFVANHPHLMHQWCIDVRARARAARRRGR